MTILGTTMRLAALCGLMCVAVNPAMAQDSLLLAGAEVSDQAGYAYLGSIIPIGDGVLGNGWVHRLWLDHNRYQYESGSRDIHVERSATEYALGYHGGTPQKSYAIYLGAGYAHTTVDPVDPKFDERGGKVRARMSGELGIELPLAWRGDLIASHTFGRSDYWLRGRFTHAAGKFRVGPEFIAQGDENYSMTKLGLLFSGIPLGKQGNLMLKAGEVWDDTRAKPYAGIEFTMPY